MRNNLGTALKLSALSIALLAAGCGGGGGDDDDTPAASTFTVQGVAAKGIIKKGQVQVFSLDAQGTKSTSPIATTTTADDGSYTVNIPQTVLNFVVEVGTAAGATMADEATGLDIPVPASMKLRNVVALSQASSSTYTGHVSPLTEMAVKTAEKSGGLSAANVAKAKAGVIVAMGFDPEKVKPINSNSTAAATATEEEKLQSLTLAALSKMAADSKLDCAQTAAADRVACVVDKVAASATISGDNLVLDSSLQTTVRTALATVAASTTINQTGKTSIEGTASFSQSTVSASTGTATGLLAAKQLVASLRNTGNALSNGTKTGALDMRAATLKQDFDLATAPLDQDLLNWMTILPQGIDHFERYKAGTVTSAGLSVWSGGSMIGSCTVSDKADGSTVASSPSAAVSVSCGTHQTYVLNSKVDGQNGSYTLKFVNKGTTLVPGTEPNTYTYRARTRLITRTYNASPAVADVVATLGNYGTDTRATGTISYAKSGTLLTSLTVTGMMPARVDSYGDLLTDHELWNVNFLRSGEGNNLYKYAFSGDFTSVKNSVTAGKIAVGTGSFARVQEDVNGEVAKEFNLLVSGEAGSSKIAGELNLSNGSADKNGYGYRPTKGVFKGTLTTSSAEFFSGTLTYEDQNYGNFDSFQPVSATNYITQTVSLAGKITVPNRPVLDLSLSVTGNNATEATNLLGQFKDGTTVINASVSHGAAGRIVAISTSAGASVTIAAGQETGDLMKDNVKLGVVNVGTGIINYVDGSFESLK